MQTLNTQQHDRQHDRQHDKEIDMFARRAEVVGRLLDRGLSVRLLHALFPGWEDIISFAVADRPAAQE